MTLFITWPLEPPPAVIFFMGCVFWELYKGGLLLPVNKNIQYIRKVVPTEKQNLIKDILNDQCVIIYFHTDIKKCTEMQLKDYKAL